MMKKARRRKPAKPKRRRPMLGDVNHCRGMGWDVYTMRGWVHVDTSAERDEELQNLASLYEKGEPNGR